MSDKFNPAECLRTLVKRRKVRDSKTGQEHWVEEEHQYLDVKYRILWFRQVYPKGFIETTELMVTDKYSRIEAVIYDNDPAAGGNRLGKARRQVWASDFKDYVEKAETQAIGRALALAGFGTQFCDELDEGDTVADSPVAVNKGSHSNPGERLHINKDINLQHERIYKAAAVKGLTKEDVVLLSRLKYQKNSLHQLNNDELAALLTGLRNTSQKKLQTFMAKLKAHLKGGHHIA